MIFRKKTFPLLLLLLFLASCGGVNIFASPVSGDEKYDRKVAKSVIEEKDKKSFVLKAFYLFIFFMGVFFSKKVYLRFKNLETYIEHQKEAGDFEVAIFRRLSCLRINPDRDGHTLPNNKQNSK